MIMAVSAAPSRVPATPEAGGDEGRRSGSETRPHYLVTAYYGRLSGWIAHNL